MSIKRVLSNLDARDEGPARDLRRHALAVGALSVALAMALEVVQLLATMAVGGHFGLRVRVEDMLLKLPWALAVCIGLWAGSAAGRGRPFITGLVGLIVAPLASLGARATAEFAHTLTFAAGAPAAPSPLLVAGLKGVEYACLGMAVAWLRERRWARASHHAAAGLCVGLGFGGGILLLTAAIEPLTPVVMVGWLVNELLFPVGCALILFRVEGRGRQAAAAGRPAQEPRRATQAA
jgi:hypothetical protein